MVIELQAVDSHFISLLASDGRLPVAGVQELQEGAGAVPQGDPAQLPRARLAPPLRRQVQDGERRGPRHLAQAHTSTRRRALHRGHREGPPPQLPHARTLRRRVREDRAGRAVQGKW